MEIVEEKYFRSIVMNDRSSGLSGPPAGTTSDRGGASAGDSAGNVAPRVVAK